MHRSSRCAVSLLHLFVFPASLHSVLPALPRSVLPFPGTASHSLIFRHSVRQWRRRADELCAAPGVLSHHCQQGRDVQNALAPRGVWRGGGDVRGRTCPPPTALRANCGTVNHEAANACSFPPPPFREGFSNQTQLRVQMRGKLWWLFQKFHLS